ncbi:MAG: sensor histidine kinase [Propionibacteriaceae bacterium]|nr:sensor histidine kinase [Propionibacteriaceae bacterium]
MLRIPADIKPHIQLGEQQSAYFEALIDDWHILADLSFSDLILWVPGIDDNEFYAIAQIRPTTGPTALEDDVVGEAICYDPEHLVTQAYLSSQICQTSDAKLQAGIPVDVWAVPLMMAGKCWGIIERHTNQMGMRAPGDLEDHYLSIADILMSMAWHGEFPDQGHGRLTSASPAVGEGMVLLDTAGVVEYATPNAVTAHRKLGLTTDLVGEPLVPLIMELTSRSGNPVDTALSTHFRSPTSDEVEVDTGHSSVFMRILPLTRDRERIGTLVILRDTTELRRRERQLVTKDATIREIHHRVKNNLQTVSALLRLQARRMTSPEAADALREAMARVQAIAVVHEILSYSMTGAMVFDDVADRLLRLAGDLATERGHVNARREGTFGEVPAAVSTSLSLILTELCQNAIKHGMASGSGNLLVRPVRESDGSLSVSVIDDGRGLPQGFHLDDKARTSLGLSIVTTLLEDLHGTFILEPNPDGAGAVATVRIPLRS